MSLREIAKQSPCTVSLRVKRSSLLIAVSLRGTKQSPGMRGLLRHTVLRTAQGSTARNDRRRRRDCQYWRKSGDHAPAKDKSDFHPYATKTSSSYSLLREFKPNGYYHFGPPVLGGKKLKHEGHQLKTVEPSFFLHNPNIFLEFVSILRHLQHASRKVEKIHNTEVCYGTTSEL